MCVLSRKKTITILLLLLLPIVVSSRPAGVGFQARLDNPLDVRERAVASYINHQDDFSAAMYPLSYSVLNREMIFDANFTASNFKDQSMRFETSYHRGRIDLVPISVNALEYMHYRIALSEREQRRQNISSAMVDARQQNARQGLSIGVNLPKRFDQMFGEGGANLRVSGFQRITFSGRSQWNDNAQSGIRKQSRFPSLRMEQISRFDITGTIGTKISVRVSQDNQTEIPLANRLIIRYKGDEDDIIKAIEAGNTNLNLPNTRFVGYSSNIRGLFGLKAVAQLGNLRLTAIASQEKGSSESASISATGEENSEITRDYNYVEGRIFDLAYPGDIGPRDSIRNLYIYEEDTRTSGNLGEISQVRLLIDADNPDYFSLLNYTIAMRQLGSETFELLYGQDSLKCPIAVVFYAQKYNRALGVYMEIARVDENGATIRVDTVGNFRSDSTFDATMQYLRGRSGDYNHENPNWQLMWKNCYRIAQGAQIEDIDLKLFKGLKGREGTSSSIDVQSSGGSTEGPYLQITGLDQYNNNLRDVKIPDGILDDRPEVFRPDWGLIIFPHREPFASDTTYTDQSGVETAPLRDTVSTIYNFNSSLDKTNSSKYYIQLSSKIRSSIIRLGRANIIEGSERVTLNGQPLQEGTDYQINYDFGQVTLLSDAAIDPNADVRVEFQYAPFLSLQKKSLLGMRAEYELNRDFKIGATVLYKTDKAENRKPRIGQETAKAMVLDFDASFAFKPMFLTKVVNALPFLSTESASRIQITAEIAQSRPNPNVDGQAYIDDFESAVELLSLGLSRTRWTLSSEPIPIRNYNEGAPVEPSVRGTLRWHNPPQVAREDVYEGDVAAGEGGLTPLRLIFRPRPAIYPDSTCSGIEIPTRSWGGIMRSFGNRVDEERVKLFEVRAKGGTGTLHFDFGKISEDIDGDLQHDNEDIGTIRNFTLDDGEDIGLDGFEDVDEQDKCSNPYNAITNPDPAGDNWWFNGVGNGAGNDNQRPPVSDSVWRLPNYQNRVTDPFDWLYYEWINGTDGNGSDDAVQGISDDEALGDHTFERSNSYFSFTLPLDPLTSPYVVTESEKNGWFTYRVPIRDPGIIDTVQEDLNFNPGWKSVTHARVWYENLNSKAQGIDSLGNIDSIWIADWGFVQSNWKDTLFTSEIDDLSEFHVASVSEEDLTFIPPPGVEPFEDKVRNVVEAQRGLALVYANLDPGAVALAFKELINTESYSGYRRLKMYVHGPANIGSDSLLFFFRIGRDSLNYYEYSTYVKADWDPDNYVDIDFNEITALKDAAIKNLKNFNDPVDTSDGPYHIVGRPNINEIRLLQAGLINHGNSRISGEVWIDELRVTDVRRDIGTAARVSIAGSAADLLSYNFGFEHRDPFFRGLSQATRGGSSNNLGSGREQNSLNYGATLNLNKFLPRSWSASLPITASYSENEDIPLLRTNSDVVLPDEVRELEKSISKSYKFSVRESFRKKGAGPLFSLLLNRQSISFSYNRSNRRTVNNPLIFGENYNIKADFDMGSKKRLEIPLFGWTKSIPILKKAYESKLNLYPDQWKWSATYNRVLQVQDDQDFKRTSSFSRTMDGSINMSYKIFPNLTTGYTMRTRRDLTDDQLVNIALSNMRLGIENNFNENIRLSYDPKLFTFLTGSISYTGGYNDTYDRSTETRNSNVNRSITVSGNFNHLILLSGSSKRRTRTPRITRGRRNEEDLKEAEKPKGDPFYKPVVKGLKFMTGWLSPLTYRYSENFNQSIPGIILKPSWKYRFGFDTKDDFPRGKTNRNPSASKTTSYDFGSGFTFLGGLSTTIKYRSNITTDLVRVGSDLNENRSISWPDLTLSIKPFKTLPLIKNHVNWFIKIFSPRTGYSRQLKENQNLRNGWLINESESRSRSPLLSINFKIMRALSLSGSYSTTTSTDIRYGVVDGYEDSRTIADRKTLAFSTRYSFTSPSGISIPFFGKLKFKSTVSIDLNVKYNSNLSRTSKEGGKYEIGAKSSDFSISPVISYVFSKQIKGGITGRWQDNNDVKFNRKSHVRELQLWTEIRF